MACILWVLARNLTIKSSYGMWGFLQICAFKLYDELGVWFIMHWFVCMKYKFFSVQLLNLAINIIDDIILYYRTIYRYATHKESINFWDRKR